MSDSERIAELEDVLRDVARQFGHVKDGKLWASGSTLESVFAVLGWSNPCEAPAYMVCDEPGCKNQATCGWPSNKGYRRTCYEHMKRLQSASIERRES